MTPESIPPPLDVTAGLARLAEAMPAEPSVIAVYLYGSYGTELQGPLSDVDLAIVTRKRARPDFDEECRLRSEILRLLGTDLASITFLRQSGPIFQFEVLSTGRLLYQADEEALADFVAEVLSRHADYRIDHDRFLQEYDEALRGEVLAD